MSAPVRQVGDAIPDATLYTMGETGPGPVQSSDILGSGKVVLFAVPGAFTPGCSKIHLPGYVEHGAELKAKGVDTIACIAVNDAWVMDAWGKAHGVGDEILMLADPDGAFTTAMGLAFDGSGFGLGQRSQRYAAVLEGGVITDLQVEPTAGVDLSSCESMLTRV